MTLRTGGDSLSSRTKVCSRQGRPLSVGSSLDTCLVLRARTSGQLLLDGSDQHRMSEWIASFHRRAERKAKGADLRDASTSSSLLPFFPFRLLTGSDSFTQPLEHGSTVKSRFSLSLSDWPSSRFALLSLRPSLRPSLLSSLRPDFLLLVLL